MSWPTCRGRAVSGKQRLGQQKAQVDAIGECHYAPSQGNPFAADRQFPTSQSNLQSHCCARVIARAGRSDGPRPRRRGHRRTRQPSCQTGCITTPLTERDRNVSQPGHLCGNPGYRPDRTNRAVKGILSHIWLPRAPAPANIGKAPLPHAKTNALEGQKLSRTAEVHRDMTFLEFTRLPRAQITSNRRPIISKR